MVPAAHNGVIPHEHTPGGVAGILEELGIAQTLDVECKGLYLAGVSVSAGRGDGDSQLVEVILEDISLGGVGLHRLGQGKGNIACSHVFGAVVAILNSHIPQRPHGAHGVLVVVQQIALTILVHAVIEDRL